VGMICIGIPTLRPLYLKMRGITSAYENHGRSRNSELPQFAMVKNKSADTAASHNFEVSASSLELGLAKPSNAYIRVDRNNSEEFKSQEQRDPMVIWVKNEVQVHRDDIQSDKIGRSVSWESTRRVPR
jgi:hypothetical protein